MSKLSQSRLILRYINHISSKSSAPTIPNASVNSSGIAYLISQQPKVVQNPIGSPWVGVLQRANFSSAPASRFSLQNSTQKLNLKSGFLPNTRNLIGFRKSSFKMGKPRTITNMNFGKNLVKNPTGALKDVASRYRDAVRLQIEAFWKRNYLAVLGTGGVVVCIILWRVMFGIANTFIGFSEGMAKYGFLALSTAMVAFAVSSYLQI